LFFELIALIVICPYFEKWESEERDKTYYSDEYFKVYVKEGFVYERTKHGVIYIFNSIEFTSKGSFVVCALSGKQNSVCYELLPNIAIVAVIDIYGNPGGFKAYPGSPMYSMITQLVRACRENPTYIQIIENE